MTWDDLIQYNRRWVDLHQHNPFQAEAARRMTAVLDAMEALLSDEAVERAAWAYKTHTKIHTPIEDREISCEECGWAFDWQESPRDIDDAPGFNGERMNRRMHDHGMRAALTAAIGEEKQ